MTKTIIKALKDRIEAHLIKKTQECRDVMAIEIAARKHPISMSKQVLERLAVMEEDVDNRMHFLRIFGIILGDELFHVTCVHRVTVGAVVVVNGCFSDHNIPCGIPRISITDNLTSKSDGLRVRLVDGQQSNAYWDGDKPCLASDEEIRSMVENMSDDQVLSLLAMTGPSPRVVPNFMSDEVEDSATASRVSHLEEED